jgi:hypothetical protein
VPSRRLAWSSLSSPFATLVNVERNFGSWKQFSVKQEHCTVIAGVKYAFGSKIYLFQARVILRLALSK